MNGPRPNPSYAGRALRFAAYAVVALCAFTGISTAAQEEQETKLVTDAEAKAALATFRAAFARDDFDLPVLLEHHRWEAVKRLAELDHPLVAKELLGHLKSDLPKVLYATIEGLGRQSRDAKSVARKLERSFNAHDADERRLREVISALGRLQHKKMAKQFVSLFSHKSDEVVFAAIRALGDIGDLKMLPKLKELYELNAIDTKGVNVRVDTGSPGGADRARARQAGKRMQQMIRRDRKAVAQVMNKALTKLCGEKIESAEQLGKWMEKNKRKWR